MVKRVNDRDAKINVGMFSERLIQSLQLLAADSNTQIDAFPDYVHIPDELALTYHDCFLLTDQIAEVGLLNRAQVAKQREIDDVLSRMSDTEELWTLGALRDSYDWMHVRRMATDALALLGRRKQQPQIDWIEYVR